jgi:aryl-alcohol dehydrogenase-like predicted oxidoreductase
MTPAFDGPQLAAGLLEIGRAWGHLPAQVPDDSAAVAFLHNAFNSGIRIFDTAPSYAHSERRFGLFLRELTASQRAEITIATKFGETWSFERNEPDTSHDYDALMRSLDQSLVFLGRIDILQLHKSTPEVLQSTGVRRAFDAARLAGITTLGASLKDLDSARLVCADPTFQLLQIPYNRLNRAMEPVFELARQSGRLLFINRPFAMGELLQAEDRPAAIRESFEAILQHPFQGAILCGSRSSDHLRQNLEIFRAAR